MDETKHFTLLLRDETKMGKFIAPWTTFSAARQHHFKKFVRGRFQKFPDWVDNEITTINTRWEATQRVVAAKLTRLTLKIAIQLHTVAESSTICSSHSRRPVWKLLDTPSYIHVFKKSQNSPTFPYHWNFYKFNPFSIFYGIYVAAWVLLRLRYRSLFFHAFVYPNPRHIYKNLRSWKPSFTCS
jgi:hypothetical protein